MRVGRTIHRLGLDIAQEIAGTVDPPLAVEAQLTILGYVLGAADAGRLLIASGHVRASQAQLRAMIEGLALIECLHGNEKLADEWTRAATPRERRKFDYGALKQCSPMASEFQPVWDSLNEYVHTNRTALPTHSRMRVVFGYDIPIGPTYDVFPMVTSLTLINWLEYLVVEWAAQHLVGALPARLRRRTARVGQRAKEIGNARHALPPSESVADGISAADQRRAVAHITGRARRAGRSDVARWVIARTTSRRNRV
jgi:hypothetical protein